MSCGDSALHEDIRGAVEGLGITHAEAAQRCGLSRSYLTRIMSGVERLSPRAAVALSTLGLPGQDWLMEQASEDFERAWRTADFPEFARSN